MMQYAENQTYTNKTIDGAIKNVVFTDCEFINCTFPRTLFLSCTFIDCTFSSCNFISPSFTECTMRGGKINGGHYVGINWEDLKPKLGNIPPFSELKNASLKLCTLVGLSLKGYEFGKTEWNACYFHNCDLSESNFSGNDFTSTEFLHCNLKGCNFKEARNCIIDPKVNRIEKAKFSYMGAIALLQSFGIIIE